MLIIKSEFRSAMLRLSSDDQRRVQAAIFKIDDDPLASAPGLRRKKMKAADFLEFRASDDLRIIASQRGSDMVLLHVGHHDEALQRAERGFLKSGDLGDVDRYRNLGLPVIADEDGIRPSGPLSTISDESLERDFSVPSEWIPTLRSIRTEEQYAAQSFDELLPEAAFWKLAEYFPKTAAVSTAADPTFRVFDRATLRRFLDGVTDDLHFNLPATSWALIERQRAGAAYVRGGPGSGKSLVLLYRALHLLGRETLLDTPRILLATYTKQLTEDARTKAQRLHGELPRSFVIATVDKIAHGLAGRGCTIFDRDRLVAICRKIADSTLKAERLEAEFVLDEISEVIEWRGLREVEAYVDVRRDGRGAALRTSTRRAIWSVYEALRAHLRAHGERTPGMMRLAALDTALALPETQRYDAVLIDEVQDLPTPALAMLTALAKGVGQAKDLIIAGDGAQSIYSRGFSWKDVGLRFGGGNVFTLISCERSTKQITEFGSALLLDALGTTDVETVVPSALSGEKPLIVDGFEDRDDQREFLVQDVRERIAARIRPDAIAVIVRSVKELSRVQAALEVAHVPVIARGEDDFFKKNAVRLLTCHSAKGLEFSEVYVLGVDDGTFPLLQSAGVSDDERDAAAAQDARLLYVAVSRARHRLTMLCGRRPSPFLANARGGVLCNLRSVVAS